MSDPNGIINLSKQTKGNTMTTLTISKTEEVLQSMFMEDTGINMLDSGGDYDRHWQKNAGAGFIDLPPAYSSNGTPVLSTYHYLAARLEYSEFQTEQFQSMWSHVVTPQMAEMIEFVEYCELDTGNYGRDLVSNSFNWETLLDQNIQFIEYRMGSQLYVMLQIHNGADARGGYTEPKIFTADEGWFHQVQDIDLACELCCLSFSVKGYDVDGYDEVGTDVGRDSFAYSWDGEYCPSCMTAFSVSAPEVYC